MVNPISCVIPEIIIQNNRALTTSIAVANYFQKEHKHVLHKIRSLECSPAFTTANFSTVVVNVQAGFNERETEAYEMTRNGFIFLVMGFTGKRAAAFKEAYIAEFDRMEAELTQQQLSILPATSGRYQILLTMEDCRVVSAELVGSDKMLASYAEFVEMVQRTGSVVIPEETLRTISSVEIVALCETARLARVKWQKIHSSPVGM